MKETKNISHLREKDIERIDKFFRKAGYEPNKDYKINFFETKTELIIVNEKLYKEFRAIIRTSF